MKQHLRVKIIFAYLNTPRKQIGRRYQLTTDRHTAQAATARRRQRLDSKSKITFIFCHPYYRGESFYLFFYRLIRLSFDTQITVSAYCSEYFEEETMKSICVSIPSFRPSIRILKSFCFKIDMQVVLMNGDVI